VLSAVREFDGESDFTIADTFTGGTSTNGTSAQVEFGANAQIGKVDVWGGLNWTDGGAIDGVWGGQIGVRYTW
jgi:outer membrane autotransporter protein